MAQNICIMLAIYTVRGVVGLANYWLAFEKFFVFPSLKQKKAKWIGIGVYFVINYLYEPMIHYGPLSLYYVILALYLVRIVPFLWAGYGFDWTYMALALFYGNWIECISQNIQIVFVENISGGLYYAFEADIFCDADRNIGVLRSNSVGVVKTIKYLKSLFYKTDYL